MFSLPRLPARRTHSLRVALAVAYECWLHVNYGVFPFCNYYICGDMETFINIRNVIKISTELFNAIYHTYDVNKYQNSENRNISV